MAMGPPTMVGLSLTVLNSVLLVILSVVWLQNYRRFQSSLLLGLVGFSLVLLVENAVAAVFFTSGMTMLYGMDPLVGQVVIGMRVLELTAVGFLTVVTLR